MDVKPQFGTSRAFSANGNPYHGPADGRSRKAKQSLKACSNAVLGLAYKLELKGEEHLPDGGAHVYAANHPGYLDPLVMSKVAGSEDLRFMAAIENFKTSLGAKVNEWAGAFPVDRKNPHPETMRHAEGLFAEGASLGIFPQGKPPDQIGVLGPIKPGAALFAVRGQADSVVPMAIQYVAGEKPGTASRLKSLLKGALAATVGVVAAAIGGVGGVAAVAGGVAGSGLGARVACGVVKNPDIRTPFPRLLGGAAGGLLGATAGVVGLGALVTSLPLGGAFVAVGVAAGAGTYLWDQMAEGRDRVEVLVQPPVSVKDHMSGREERGAVSSLTNALHRSIGGALQTLSGVPYQPQEPESGFRQK